MSPATKPLPNGAPLLWVTARAGETLPRALSRSGSASRTLVVPGTLPGRRAAFTVAGCSGYPLAARELVEAA